MHFGGQTQIISAAVEFSVPDRSMPEYTYSAYNESERVHVTTTTNRTYRLEKKLNGRITARCALFNVVNVARAVGAEFSLPRFYFTARTRYGSRVLRRSPFRLNSI